MMKKGFTTLVVWGIIGAIALLGAFAIQQDNVDEPDLGVAPRVLRESQGGTNQSTYTAGDILFSDTANSLAKLGIGSNDQVLTLAAGIPSWADAAAGGGGGGLWTDAIGFIYSGLTTASTTDDTVLIGSTATNTTEKLEVWGGVSADTFTASSTTGTSTFSGSLNIGTTSPYTSSEVNIEIQTPGNHGLIIQGALNQDSHLFMLRDNAGSILLDVNANGEVDLFHTATGNDEIGLSLNVDAVTFAEIIPLFINFDVGALADGEDETGFLSNIDIFDTTGGDVHHIQCDTSTGSASADCLKVTAGTGVFEQEVGVFGNVGFASTTALGDTTSQFNSAGTDVTLFASDNDVVVVADLSKFQEIEFVLATVASGAGIKPSFRFSTACGSWTTFSPNDGTNGMRNATGLITFDDEDIPTWAAGCNNAFEIEITRTQNGLATPPVEDIVQIAAVSLFYWNVNADFLGRNSTTTHATTTDLSISGQLDVDGLTSALVLTGAGGVFAEYTGVDCTNQFIRDLDALGAGTCNDVTLATDTTGDFVADITGGAGIDSDGATSGEDISHTLTFDATELDALTWSDNANASNTWTFDVSGTDHTAIFGSALTTWSGGITTTLDLIVNGLDITLGATGVQMTSDNDGALTFLGLSAGFDEDLTYNFDDTENEVSITSSTGVNLFDLNTIGLDTDSLTVGADTVTSLDGDGTLNIVSANLRVVDLTCTNCIGVTEIEDVYLLDDGDTGTGVFDFGGTTSFEITNASNPTVDTAGEVALDSTDEHFLVADSGGTARVIQTEVRIWGVTVASTSPAFISAGLLEVPTQLDGYTMTRVQCHVVTGTSKVIAVEDASANTTEDITCATTNTTDDGSITNATVTASELMRIDFGATSGSVDTVSISVFGTWTRE